MCIIKACEVTDLWIFVLHCFPYLTAFLNSLVYSVFPNRWGATPRGVANRIPGDSRRFERKIRKTENMPAYLF
jgi:hypothetical protein